MSYSWPIYFYIYARHDPNLKHLCWGSMLLERVFTFYPNALTQWDDCISKTVLSIFSAHQIYQLKNKKLLTMINDEHQIIFFKKILLMVQTSSSIPLYKINHWNVTYKRNIIISLGRLMMKFRSLAASTMWYKINVLCKWVKKECFRWSQFLAAPSLVDKSPLQ